LLEITTKLSQMTTTQEIPKKSFVIKDPVHGYIRIAAHERIVVDHPITQRLRRITQTGLAEFIFPEARTSRFAHSLGAMHLASRFVINCLINAREDDALAFFESIQTLDFFKNFQIKLSDLDSLLLTDPKAGVGGGGLLAADSSFREVKLRSTDHKRLLALVEAAVRLAALFHDLGHMPFSHDFEYALRDYVGKKKRANLLTLSGLTGLFPGQPHETVGHKLAQLVFQVLVENANLDPATRAAFAFARDILNVEEHYDDVPRPRVTAQGWLHSLVDGQLDVDRADYLLRDGRALGLEFASYDLERLIVNLVMSHDEDLGFVTAVDERGFSALESYCLSRSRSNQVLVRHHKSAQLAAALRYASVEALDAASAQIFLQDLATLGESKPLSIENAEALLKRFATYDDPWWTGVLRSIDKENSDELLGLSLGLVLRRQRTFHSLWKRKGDLSDKLLADLNKQAGLAKSEPERFETSRRELQDKQKTLLVLHTFNPYSMRAGGGLRDSILLVKTRNGLRSASALSPLIRSLDSAWQEDIHLHAFAPMSSTLSAEDLLKALSRKVQKAASKKKKKKKKAKKNKKASKSRK
jgi:HD superfamily phosphohydrolase